MPTDIIQNANIEDFHILVPVYVKKLAQQKAIYNYSIALATQ